MSLHIQQASIYLAQDIMFCVLCSFFCNIGNNIALLVGTEAQILFGDVKGCALCNSQCLSHLFNPCLHLFSQYFENSLDVERSDFSFLSSSLANGTDLTVSCTFWLQNSDFSPTIQFAGNISFKNNIIWTESDLKEKQERRKYINSGYREP